MASYTVQSGDTLSGIAQKLGLGSYKDLSGYKSGNPGLIYAGEVLNYGGSTPPSPASSGSTAGSYTEFARQNAQQWKDLLNQQNQTQENAFNQYQQTISGQESLTSAYDRLKNELKIPELQQTSSAIQSEIFKVKNLLNNLDQNVTDRTRGTLTTEAQRQRMGAYEAQPLQKNLGTLSTSLEPIMQNLSGANQQVQTLLQLQRSDQDRQLKPLEMQISSLSDRFARELTGFSNSKTTELNALVDKINRDRELSDREWQRTQQLASEEREFSRQKQLANMELDKYNKYLTQQSFDLGNYIKQPTFNQSQSLTSGGLVVSGGLPSGMLNLNTVNPLLRLK